MKEIKTSRNGEKCLYRMLMRNSYIRKIIDIVRGYILILILSSMDFITRLSYAHNHSNKFGMNFIDSHFKAANSVYYTKLWNLDLSISQYFLKSCLSFHFSNSAHAYYFVSFKFKVLHFIFNIFNF